MVVHYEVTEQKVVQLEIFQKHVKKEKKMIFSQENSFTTQNLSIKFLQIRSNLT